MASAQEIKTTRVSKTCPKCISVTLQIFLAQKGLIYEIPFLRKVGK
jgi:hypothetical protein